MRVPTRELHDLEERVDARMSELAGNFYKNLFEPNQGYTRKQDLDRLRKMLPRMAVGSFSFARVRKMTWRYGSGWRGGDRVTGWGTRPCALQGSEKRRFKGVLN